MWKKLFGHFKIVNCLKILSFLGTRGIWTPGWKSQKGRQDGSTGMDRNALQGAVPPPGQMMMWGQHCSCRFWKKLTCFPLFPLKENAWK